MSSKVALSWDQQVELLVRRELEISDLTAVRDFLKAENYYRFSGYARYFQREPHYGDDRFQPRTTFEEISISTSAVASPPSSPASETSSEAKNATSFASGQTMLQTRGLMSFPSGRPSTLGPSAHYRRPSSGERTARSPKLWRRVSEWRTPASPTAFEPLCIFATGVHTTAACGTTQSSMPARPRATYAPKRRGSPVSSSLDPSSMW